MTNERCREVILQLYPVENLSDSRNKIKALFGENFSSVDELFEGAIKDICEKISRGNKAEIYASEIFYTLAGSFLLEHPISKEASAIILEYLYQLMDIAGFFPSFIIEEWKKKSRIYSTYYSLVSVYLLEGEGSIKTDIKWIDSTIRWLISCQQISGENRGAFVEKDCPTTTSPEMTLWALWCLDHLNQITIAKQYDITQVKNTACQWITEKFLAAEKDWSITRLFYAVSILKKNNLTIPPKHVEKIKNFINALRKMDGFLEFHPSVKEGYREDKGQVHSSFHSTVYAYMTTKMLGEFPNAESRELVLNFKSEKGFGTQIKIKDYLFGPTSTLAENFLAMVFGLT